MAWDRSKRASARPELNPGEPALQQNVPLTDWDRRFEFWLTMIDRIDVWWHDLACDYTVETWAAANDDKHTAVRATKGAASRRIASLSSAIIVLRGSGTAPPTRVLVSDLTSSVRTKNGESSQTEPVQTKPRSTLSFRWKNKTEKYIMDAKEGEDKKKDVAKEVVEVPP